MARRTAVLAVAGLPALLGCAELLDVGEWEATTTSGASGASQGGGGGGAIGAAGGASSSTTTTTGGSGGCGGPTGCGVDYGAAVLDDGPVAYWRLDEPIRSIGAISLTGSHHGVYVGSVALGNPGIVAGSLYAARFGPNNTAYVDVGDDPTFEFETQKSFTLEAWVRLSSFGEFARPVAKITQESASDGYMFFVHSDGAVNLLRNVTGVAEGPKDISPKLLLDTTYHLVATYDGTQACVYVNGVEAECVLDSRNLLETSASLTLGASQNGDVDEVAIYDKRLSAPRIAVHYEAGHIP